MRSDVALYHEMVHADHLEDGTMDRSGKVSFAEHPWDWFRGINESEHQAVGIGKHKGEFLSEDHYRAERNAIGKHGTGAVDGDADMPQRNDYGGIRVPNALLEMKSFFNL
jgi:hypothetical protein